MHMRKLLVESDLVLLMHYDHSGRSVELKLNILCIFARHDSACQGVALAAFNQLSTGVRHHRYYSLLEPST